MSEIPITADELSRRIDGVVSEGRTHIRTSVIPFFNAADVGTNIEVSSAKSSDRSGATQQIYNRLAQTRVQQATDLTILYVQKDERIEGLLDYIEGAFRGEKGEPRIPVGPIAIAQPGEDGQHKIVAIVAERATRASRLVESLYGPETRDPRGEWEPTLPDDAEVYRVRLKSSMSEQNLERLIFNVSQGQPQSGPMEGDVILYTDGESEVVLAIAQVARTVDTKVGRVAILAQARVLDEAVELPVKS